MFAIIIYSLLFISISAIFLWEILRFPRRNITQVTIWGSILDLFQSINIFALLNILSDEAYNAWTAKYCLETAARFGKRWCLSFHHACGLLSLVHGKHLLLMYWSISCLKVAINSPDASSVAPNLASEPNNI